MSLREMVTGNDACTPEGGAGPSNAFSGLANNLLGNSSKAQERLKEIPGFHGLPGASEARFMPQRPEDAALAAAEAEGMQMPGMRPRHDTGDLEQFFPGSRQGGAKLSGWGQEFEEMQGRMGRGAAAPSNRFPSQAALAPFLQAFVRRGNVPPQMQSLPAPKMDLTLEDECQIRDRSTIMARHLFSEGGDHFADEQVHRLLHSLQIDPRALPTQPQQGGWDRIFNTGSAHPRDGRMVHDVVMQNRMLGAARPAVDRWADQFANLDLQEDMPSGDQLAAEFLNQPGLESQGWAEEFAQGPGADWAAEFGQTQAADSRGVGKTGTGTSADVLEQTRALRDTLQASQDPKFRKSKFLQFVSKMSRGEIVLEDNQAKEVPGAATGNQWAEEHQAASREANMEEAWNNYNQQADGGRSSWVDEFQGEQHPPNAWADQFQADHHPPNAWANQFAGENGIAESWAEDFASNHVQHAPAGPGEQEYVMAANNPFLSDLDSFAKGKELFRNGLLSEARLALEAEVQRQPGNVEAWRLLGTVHAENDNDQQAIAALNKALLASPGNPEVLLSLGVSYTNELDQRRAITYLMQWLSQQPGQAGAASVQLPANARESLRVAVDIFRTAAQMNARSADAHVALGVLYNLSRDFDGAVAAFRTALQTRSIDYSLWNKLGATLANSGRSSEAIDAYQKALELKPNYMRAWVNMGISQANVGEYETSIRFYGRALTLNPQAAPVWGYLRTSISCAGRDDLLGAVDDEDLDAITTALPL